ncbi:spore gernimation protein GerPD [Alkalibacillus haloalkaliphilus]|uniref:spore gernimation protein GerPD n=1 Tax=Alkalibacillus haloalkaliphilus TaxID=94136 RepID=UPI0029354CC5|nr:spore gernimation protein GerPD [Alkalibacillus haloalkaliphilus]MDV2583198.1 spore gernimation protein GerPD [Alkalibacillus haloalkaliphilus]
MNVNFVNEQLSVGNIEVTGVSSSSLFLVGDADHLQFTSTFDTPPESYFIESVVPFSAGR